MHGEPWAQVREGGKGWMGLKGEPEGLREVTPQQPLTCTQLQRLQSLRAAAMSILPLFTSSRALA